MNALREPVEDMKPERRPNGMLKTETRVSTGRSHDKSQRPPSLTKAEAQDSEEEEWVYLKQPGVTRVPSTGTLHKT